MIINLVIVLLIIIILCNSITHSGKYKCPNFPFKINYVRGSRLPESINTERVGISTVNLKLDRDVPCGMYNVENSYGNAILIVSRDNYRIGYMNMKNMDIIKNIDLFDIWNLKRMESDDNLFISTYNRGCC